MSTLWLVLWCYNSAWSIFIYTFTLVAIEPTEKSHENTKEYSGFSSAKCSPRLQQTQLIYRLLLWCGLCKTTQNNKPNTTSASPTLIKQDKKRMCPCTPTHVSIYESSRQPAGKKTGWMTDCRFVDKETEMAGKVGVMVGSRRCCLHHCSSAASLKPTGCYLI